MTTKPHKWGYKYYVLAASKGMIFEFLPYMESIEPVKDKNIPDLKAGANFVLYFTQSIPNNYNRLFYFNN